ncbi:MAG: MBL fold metallo-hydrolase [Synergistaceae bacterium]|jgi:L-ascorbate 6-phosphate lactonase|nr:MBL fold metallo-hydrolase [Synergistaceae bacterium]
MAQEIVKSDGRGIIAGDYVNQNHPMDRDQWLRDSFPEWGTLLNQEIENRKVPKGEVSLWWCGGPSWVLKTDEGGIFFIDQYCGPSMYTSLYYCGVCKQSGADSINWIRLNPHVIDPWKFNQLDGVFCTHAHQDHCDLYAVKAALQTTKAPFYAPPVAAKKLKVFEVPDDRIVVARVGESVKIKGAEVDFLICYDQTAIKTGEGDVNLPFEEAACCYLFKTSAGNILFMGDTWYHDGYVSIREKYPNQIDVAIFDMGSNAPGATDKMPPYDCARVGQVLGAKLLIPDHYDNWANTAGDPELLVNQFERIVSENTPEIKTMIMRCGGRFDYPKDKDKKRYRYPDGSENYNFSKSVFAKKK